MTPHQIQEAQGLARESVCEEEQIDSMYEQ